MFSTTSSALFKPWSSMMSDFQFPANIPEVGQKVRITSIKEPPMRGRYHSFCEEGFVANRFLAVDYTNRSIIEISLGGGSHLKTISFSVKNNTWFTVFDTQNTLLEVSILG